MKASNAETNDRFGQDVSLSADGNTLAVGANGEASNAMGIPAEPAPGTDDDSAAGAGAAYVFTRSGSTWSQQAYVKASNTQGNDSFGYKVVLSDDGDTLAVSAIWEDSVSTGIGGNQANDPLTTTNAGAVYVFTRNLAVWSQEAYIKASTVDSEDYFGASLALSSDGNTLTVGANGEDSNAVTINGDESDDSELNSGAGYVFSRSGSTWTQQAYLKASNGEAGDQFGYAMALSNDGNRLVVTAWDEDSSSTGIDGIETSNGSGNAGAAYLFTRSGSIWSQDAYIKASNTGAGDLFGASVDVNDDADTLLVGAFGEDSAATGIGGDQTSSGAAISGAGYLY